MHNQECLTSLFVFFYFSIDSTKVTGNGLGRYVNDAVASEANCKMKVTKSQNTPQLILYATRKITKGEELRYDYGVPNLPWRTEV